MRIAELHCAAFGRLTDLWLVSLDTSPAVFLGSNEAGKSTLFHLVQTILFGFSPVRDFPYRSWDAALHPEIRAGLVLDSGEEVQVQRKLSSGPRASLIQGARVTELRNQALPWTGHVSRQLYQSLYALSQANMRDLSQEERKTIEDRLLGSMGSDLFRPVRAVWQELDSRAGKLWRPDNRGKPVCQRIARDIQAARARRRQALERDRTLRDRACRLGEVDERIRILEAELDRLRALVRQADELLPVKQRLDQIRGWEARLGSREAVRALPQGLRAEVQRLEDREARALEDSRRLHQELQAASQAMAALTSDDKELLEAEPAITGWIRGWSAHEMERQGLRDLRDQLAQIRSRFELRGQQVLNGSTHPGIGAELARLDISGLKAAVDQVCQARDRLRASGSAQQAGSAGPVWWAAGLSLVLGGILTAAGWRLQQAHVLGAGTTLAVLGVLGLGGGLVRIRQTAARRAAVRREAQGDRDKLTQGLSRVASLLEGLPVDREWLEHPDQSLVQTLHDLRLDQAEMVRCRKLLKERLQQFQGKESQLQDLMDRFGESRPRGEALNRLESRLDRAKTRKASSEAARRRSAEVSELADQAADEAQAVRERKEQLLGQMRKLAGHDQAAGRAAGSPEGGGRESPGGELDAGGRQGHEKEGVWTEPGGLSTEELLAGVEELQKLLARIEEAEEQLEREIPDLDRIREEIHGLEARGDEALILDQKKVEQWRVRLSRLQDDRSELQTLREERVGLHRDLDMARGEESVGDVDGEIASLREHMHEARLERDRTALMSAILRQADRRFREKHQPEVINRAGEYLKIVTNGRYARLALLEDGRDGDALCVLTGNGGSRRVGPPLSSGTLDQIHFAFRLAVIDHLDQGQESLPLLLDEALLNWDAQRLTRGLETLGAAAEQRQIGVFTCHEWLAERVSTICGARIIDVRS